MRGPADDPLIARVAGELRRPVPVSPGFDEWVMAAVRHAPPPLRVRAWEWLREPRAVAVSPLGGLAMAAGLAALMLAGTGVGRGIGRQTSAVRVAAAPAATSTVTFVLVAPGARSVAVAGDFDGWDPARLPMQRSPSGLWTVDVPLAPGRYQYAFVLDGRRFVADPAAPRAVGDDFGTPSSVVTVAGPARAVGGSL